MRTYYVYILASKKNGTLYIGVTNSLERRLYEHSHKLIKGFTKKYTVGRLVYFEQTESIETAVNRERQLKNWHRQWKVNLITNNNPEWQDLSALVLGEGVEMDPETSSG